MKKELLAKPIWNLADTVGFTPGAELLLLMVRSTIGNFKWKNYTG
jgi:hypothetical protein